MIRKTTIRTIATATTINNIIPTSDPTTTGIIEASEAKVYKERMNANLEIIHVIHVCTDIEESID